jgi:hypothetical protein
MKHIIKFILILCSINNFALATEEIEYIADFHDIELSRHHSLISGIDFNGYKGKAAITLGYRPLPFLIRGQQARHAYLVFEYPAENEKTEEITINIAGVHFVERGQGYYSGQNLCGIAYSLGKGEIKRDERAEVLGRFLRTQVNRRIEVEDRVIDNIATELASYKKYKTFIVEQPLAMRTLRELNKTFEDSRFSILGYGIFRNKVYNCCTAAREILLATGINLEEGRWSKSWEPRGFGYLEQLINELEENMGCRMDRNIEIITPPTAEEILRGHGVNF